MPPCLVRGRLLAALAWLALAGAARADSDGHFCISDGYLAYEVREWSGRDPTKHRLQLELVGRPDGASERASVPLEDFQVHGMRCRPREITILGWNEVYKITVSDRDSPRVVSVEPMPQVGGTSQIAPAFRAESLMLMRESRTIAIPSTRSDRRYELRIDYRRVDPAASPDGAIHHRITATLVEADSTGAALRERPIYASDSEETID